MNEETRLIDPAQDNNTPTFAAKESNKYKKLFATLAGAAAGGTIGASAIILTEAIANPDTEEQEGQEETLDTHTTPTTQPETVVKHVYVKKTSGTGEEKEGLELDPDVEVLGIEEVELVPGQTSTAILVQSRTTGEISMMVDIDQNGVIDLLWVDTNGDGDISDELPVNISSMGIPVSIYEDAYNTENFIIKEDPVDIIPDDGNEYVMTDNEDEKGETEAQEEDVLPVPDAEDVDIATESDYEDVYFDDTYAYEEDIRTSPENIDDFNSMASADAQPDYNPNADTGLFEA